MPSNDATVWFPRLPSLLSRSDAREHRRTQTLSEGGCGANFRPREESGTACVSLLSAHPHEALGSTQRNGTYYQSDSGGDPRREDSGHLSSPSSHRTRSSSRVRRPPWGTTAQGILYTTRCRNSRIFNLNAVIPRRRRQKATF